MQNSPGNIQVLLFQTRDGFDKHFVDHSLGKAYIAVATVHMDETSSHMHVLLIPESFDGLARFADAMLEKLDMHYSIRSILSRNRTNWTTARSSVAFSVFTCRDLI